MKRFLFSVLLVFSVLFVFSQQQYFVFIEDTSHEPFYVRMGEKSFSSSASGHLILSKMVDSTYIMFIGFPQNKEPEQQFLIKMYSRNRGYELKKLSGQWELFDLQTMEFTKPLAMVPKDNGNMLPRRTDTYSALMAGVVNDSAVLYVNAMPPEITKKDTAVAKSLNPPTDSISKKLVKNTKGTKVKKGVSKAKKAATDSSSITKTNMKNEVGAKDSLDRKDSLGTINAVVSDAGGVEPKVQDAGVKGNEKDSGRSNLVAEIGVGKGDTGIATNVTKAESAIDTDKAVNKNLEKKETENLDITSVDKIDKGKETDSAGSDVLSKKVKTVGEDTGIKNAIEKDSTSISNPVARTEAVASQKQDMDDKGLRNLSSVLITRYSTENIAEGKLMIFIDRSAAVADTVRLIIPRL